MCDERQSGQSCNGGDEDRDTKGRIFFEPDAYRHPVMPPTRAMCTRPRSFPGRSVTALATLLGQCFKQGLGILKEGPSMLQAAAYVFLGAIGEPSVAGIELGNPEGAQPFERVHVIADIPGTEDAGQRAPGKNGIPGKE